MKDLFIDCPTGLSGDMLLSALLDLGMPKDILLNNLKALGLLKSFDLKINESKSYGFRGLKIAIEKHRNFPPKKKWIEIKEFINQLEADDLVIKNTLKVYNEIIESEALVHGCNIEDVHLHELSSIETFINIFGVCLAFNYFKFNKVFCMPPPIGFGHVKTAHGILSIPVPSVLEIAKRNKIILSGSENLPEGELTTPTGIALISVFVDSFHRPKFFEINNMGIGLGNKDLGKVNLVRVSEIKHINPNHLNVSISEACWQVLISQESWIDDSSPEDLAELMNELRAAGAIDVISYPVQMKKGRQGVNIKAIAHEELAGKLRKIWFSKASTIGLREASLGRWILPRRKGICNTQYGGLRVKQVKRPNGTITSKVEHEDLIRISKKECKSIDQIRKEISSQIDNFIPEQDWFFGGE